jgi:hypothetical protein
MKTIFQKIKQSLIPQEIINGNQKLLIVDLQIIDKAEYTDLQHRLDWAENFKIPELKADIEDTISCLDHSNAVNHVNIQHQHKLDLEIVELKKQLKNLKISNTMFSNNSLEKNKELKSYKLINSNNQKAIAGYLEKIQSLEKEKGKKLVMSISHKIDFENCLKTCPICNETKPKTDYHIKSKAKDGLQYCCKVCKRGYKRSKKVK